MMMATVTAARRLIVLNGLALAMQQQRCACVGRRSARDASAAGDGLQEHCKRKQQCAERRHVHF
jgi:hypothetical protein